MSEKNPNLETELIRWQDKLFTRSIRRKQKLERIQSLVGTTINFQCLEISSGDGSISTGLRSLGGSWNTAVSTAAAAHSVGYSLSETITQIENEKLPFEDHTFDRLVIVDALRSFANDAEFLRECHRVLKNDGWVIITESRRFPISFVALIQYLFGIAPIAKGNIRNGYTASELFNILKDGYDVPETITYSNDLFESVATLGEGLLHITDANTPYWLIPEKAGQNELYRYRKLHHLANLTYPLLWLLSKLEFFPGHKLIVKSRRRHWRPRKTPKLTDGRSIAEAAINTKIGTAAPF